MLVELLLQSNFLHPNLCNGASVPVFFFFQAEDGIRDGHVTGVQTCALPISQEAQAEEAVQSAETEVVSDENQKEVQKENIDDSAKSDVQEDVSADSATSSEDSESAEETNSSEEEEKSDK